MKYMITGGAGFIGANFISYILSKYPDAKVICIDSLTYAGNVENFKSFDKSRFIFEYADICNRDRVFELTEKHMPDCIVNFAAESHVDRSITDPSVFVRTNVLGCANLLDAAKSFNISRFHQISTDEVYGDIPEPEFSTEESPLAPSSPYSASKASADLLTLSYFKTFKTPVTISRCSNNYGAMQFPEKLIPLTIYNILKGNNVNIYGNGMQCRDWIYVADHCRAIDLILNSGIEGQIYNVGSSVTKNNIETVELIADAIGKRADIIHVTDRPAHDKRYAIDSRKLRTKLGWQPTLDYEEGIRLTVKWYLDNQQWCENIMNKSYKEKNKEYIK